MSNAPIVNTTILLLAVCCGSMVHETADVAAPHVSRRAPDVHAAIAAWHRLTDRPDRNVGLWAKSLGRDQLTGEYWLAVRGRGFADQILHAEVLVFSARGDTPTLRLSECPEGLQSEQLTGDFAAAGDFDLDGVPDILVSCFAAGGYSVHVLSLPDGELLRTYRLESSRRSPSPSMALIGDMDLDDIPDYAIGQAFWTTDHGRVLALSGASGGTLWTQMGPPGFGSQVSSWAGEALLPVHGLTIFRYDEGLWQVSRLTGERIRPLESFESRTSVLSVAGVPDVDDDGAPDFAIGWTAVTHDTRGGTQVRSSSNGMVLSSRAAKDGEVAFGKSVVGVRDLDGDGRGDLLVGCPGILNHELTFAHVIGESEPGFVAAVSGATGRELFRLATGSKGDAFGQSVIVLEDSPDALVVAIGSPGAVVDSQGSLDSVPASVDVQKKLWSLYRRGCVYIVKIRR